MAKNTKNQNERNPLTMVLYIIVVAVLVACLVFMAFWNRRNHKKFAEEVARVAAEETEFVVVRKQIQEETETETEQAADTDGAKSKSNTSVKAQQNELADDAADQSEAQTEGQSEEKSEPESETAKDAETQSKNAVPELKDLTLVVLNGTDYSGVATYWQDKLAPSGYKDILVGSYTSGVREKTAVYTTNKAAEKELKKAFPDADFYETKLSDGIALTEGQDNDAAVDVYVVVGNADAVTE